MTIVFIQGGQPSLVSYAQVIVDVTDTNDNPPIFSPASYAAEIEENMKIGSSILTVTATDADEVEVLRRMFLFVVWCGVVCGWGGVGCGVVWCGVVCDVMWCSVVWCVVCCAVWCSVVCGVM